MNQSPNGRPDDPVPLLGPKRPARTGAGIAAMVRHMDAAGTYGIQLAGNGNKIIPRDAYVSAEELVEMLAVRIADLINAAGGEMDLLRQLEEACRQLPDEYDPDVDAVMGEIGRVWMTLRALDALRKQEAGTL